MAKKPSPRDTVSSDVELGQKIRALRIARKVSQADLGEHLGVSFQQIQKYEKGLNRVSAARLQQLAAFFDVEITDFYALFAEEAVDSIILGTDPQSVRVLRAYSQIRNVETQHQLVLLIESIADGYP